MTLFLGHSLGQVRTLTFTNPASSLSALACSSPRLAEQADTQMHQQIPVDVQPTKFSVKVAERFKLNAFLYLFVFGLFYFSDSYIVCSPGIVSNMWWNQLGIIVFWHKRHSESRDGSAKCELNKNFKQSRRRARGPRTWYANRHGGPTASNKHANLGECKSHLSAVQKKKKAPEEWLVAFSTPPQQTKAGGSQPITTGGGKLELQCCFSFLHPQFI